MKIHNFEEKLVELLVPFTGRKIYKGTLLQDLSSQLIEVFNIQDNERLLIYMDGGVFSNKNGILLTPEALYYKYGRSEKRISWRRMINIGCVKRRNNHSITLGSLILYFSHSDITNDQVAQLLDSIRSMVSSIEVQEDLSTQSIVDQMRAVCSEYVGNRSYLAPLDANRLSESDLVDRFPGYEHHTAVIFLSFSKPGKVKDGILITEACIYWKPCWCPVESIPWELVAESHMYRVTDKIAMIIGRTSYDLFDCELSGEELVIVLKSLSRIAARKVEEQGASSVPQKWVMDLVDRAELPENDVLIADAFFLEYICKKHKFFISDYYPKHPLDADFLNREAFCLSTNERVVAHYRTALGKKAEYGVVITDVGIYIREPFEHSFPDAFISYDNLVQAPVDNTHSRFLLIGEYKYSFVHPQKFARLLEDIRLYITCLCTVPEGVEYPYDPSYTETWSLPVRGAHADSKRWIVVEDGMLKGLHTTEELQWAIDSRQMDRDLIKLWSYGASSWQTAEAALL
ncbi:hypothetical protein [Paenibacillus donghaensis]|uniref:DUF4339 domain-containing protein n=1 Tax=Paenibacillus donghaensis TaxID=414771 RepID=A0A2Z2KMJ0_9BACL|nr:hypothetical protein [Paenibacillus donghaensis]ASA21241.1 hypothetical protein B9T62_10855 [Paenibacillus donghaensis]